MKSICVTLFLFLTGHLLVAQIDKEIHPPLSNRITYAVNDTLYQFHVDDAPSNRNIHKDRNYYWFKHDTILVTIGDYGDHLLSGDYRTFYPNKNLYENGSFENGQKTGVWKNWYPSGVLKSVVEWSYSRKNGRFEYYDSLGKKVGYGSFKDDKMIGAVYKMNAQGVMEKQEFDSGEEKIPKESKPKKSDTKESGNSK